MASELTGLWALADNNEGEALWMFTDTHFSFVSNRLGGRGYIGTYTTDGNRLKVTRMIATPANPVVELTMEYQVEGNSLTVKIVDEGAILNVGHVDTYHKIAD